MDVGTLFFTFVIGGEVKKGKDEMDLKKKVVLLIERTIS